MPKYKSPQAIFPSLMKISELCRGALEHSEVDVAALNCDQFDSEDYQHICLFLYQYVGSKDTFKSYRRDLERLYLWMNLVADTTLKDLNNISLSSFLDFIQKPPKSWVMKYQYQRFIDETTNKEWRPFRNDGKADYVFSGSSYKALFATLSSFFKYSQDVDYIDKNPLSALRQKDKYLGMKSQHSILRLSTTQMSHCYEAADLLAEAIPAKHERTRFAFCLMLKLYLRISEVVDKPQYTPTMGDFFRDHHGNWWFNVGYGKGRKTRKVSVPDDLLDDIKRYRNFLGLPDMPSRGEETPLLPKTRGLGGIGSERQVRRILSEVFEAGKGLLIQRGLTEESKHLDQATAHWLRHTGISEDVLVRPAAHVRDDAGHSEYKTTGGYIDSDDVDRANSRRDT